MSKVHGKNARGVRTLQQLLQAACHEFADRGYAATRISDIAERAGVSTGTFYRHFTSKPEIFLEVLRPALDSLFSASRSPNPHPDRGINQEALFAAHLGFFREYTRNRQLFRSLFEAAASREDPSVTRAWMESRGRFIDRTTLWLMALYERGEVRDADFPMLADALCSGAEQLAHVHLGLQQSDPEAAQVRRMASVVTELWLAAIQRP
jgi:AcrR family transcriptional regulator